MQERSIAIDGPSGAGKSTLAKRTAEKLRYIHVDTGALYRTVALYALRRSVDIEDGNQIRSLLPDIRIDLRYDESGNQSVYLNGEDVSGLIRTGDVSNAAAVTSKMPDIRAFLLDTQRALAETRNVVMDGRDIGSVVLPRAGVKVFLTASPEVRAYRRFLEMQKLGGGATYEEVLADQKLRDETDSTRELAPLIKAPDAVELDISELDRDETFDRFFKIVAEALHV